MPKKKRRNFKFTNCKGDEYEVIFRKPNSGHYGEADGLCYNPEEESPKIYINPHLGQKSTLNTAIHEFTHAFFWNRTEKEVYAFANTLTRFLFTHCRWRKEKNGTVKSKSKCKRRSKRDRK